jgi:energy-coupling factor transporter ATP-binding protein EcfA2
MREPVVRLEGVTFTYAGSAEPALKEISLIVHPGEFVTITGPSGCGKSTLSFCLTGFIPHSFAGTMEGRALIGGQDTRGTAPGELAGIAGLVQQDPEAQLCTLHVAEEIAFGPENLGLPPAEITRRLDWALEAAGIAPLKRRSLHTLSGGEKQRVAIASVLAMRPQLLILDEPTANLDPRGCREVLAVVEKLRREQNAAIIIFEHRLQHLLPLADRLIIMEHGRITYDGRPEQPGQPGNPERTEMLPKPRRKIAAPLLQVEDLTVSYGEQPALKGISFFLNPGETVALMGDNGCGKSTLLLALLGILKPAGGRICFAGDDLAGCKVTRRAREMGLTFQNPNHQLFEKTVLKEARLPAQFLAGDQEESLARVDELLLHFDLERYRERLPFSLSLGEKKRLTLVSVLAYHPRILLLDEPLVGQDQDRLDLLLEALFEHCRRGGITIMACHEPGVVATSCSRVLFLEEGELVIDAPTETAFAELARRGRIDYLPTGPLFPGAPGGRGTG